MNERLYKNINSVCLQNMEMYDERNHDCEYMKSDGRCVMTTQESCVKCKFASPNYEAKLKILYGLYRKNKTKASRLEADMNEATEEIKFLKERLERERMKTISRKHYKYGMRTRGFSPGCQPMPVLMWEDDPTGKYYNILTYESELSPEEVESYELDFIGAE